MSNLAIRVLLSKFCKQWHPTGSFYICSPPVTDTDIDYIAYGIMSEIAEGLLDYGFKFTSETQYEGGTWFDTYRMGKYNILVTDNDVFYNRFVAATALARARNISSKADRIALFQKILYGDVVGFKMDETKKPTKHALPNPKDVDQQELI